MIFWQHLSCFSDYSYRVFGQDTYVVREDKKGKGLAKLYLLDNYGGSVNVFEKEKRAFYKLDDLWSDAKLTVYKDYN